MNKWMWGLAVMWMLSLTTCEDEAKCKLSDEGDCGFGRVCMSGKHAKEDERGNCVDGQFDSNGALVAAVVFEGFVQDEEWKWPSHRNDWGKRLSGCSGPFVYAAPEEPPPWLGMSPATVVATVQGPNAEAEQLKASMQGVALDCIKTDGADEGRQRWECHLPTEDWAEINTCTSPMDADKLNARTFPKGVTEVESTEHAELQLWTENTPTLPWIGRFQVDSMPLEMHLEAHVQGDFLWVSASKPKFKSDKGDWMLHRGAKMRSVQFLSLAAFRDGVEISLDWEPIPNSPDSQRAALPKTEQTSILHIRATITAKDAAGNEVNPVELETLVITPKKTSALDMVGGQPGQRCQWGAIC